MGTSPGYINLGSIKKSGDHGALLNSFKRSLMAVPSIKRKKNILRRLEMSEAMRRLGLSRILLDAFYFGDEEESDEQVIQRIGLQIYQALDAKFGQRLQSLAPTASAFPEPVAAITPEASDVLVPSLAGDGQTESQVIAEDVESSPVVSKPEHNAAPKTSDTVTQKENPVAPTKNNAFVKRLSGLTKLHS